MLTLGSLKTLGTLQLQSQEVVTAAFADTREYINTIGDLCKETRLKPGGCFLLGKNLFASSGFSLLHSHQGAASHQHAIAIAAYKGFFKFALPGNICPGIVCMVCV